MKLLIGNKAYSSWSMRGWLACRQSGLPFEEEVVPLYGADWTRTRARADLAPSGGRVPLLWDGTIAVWESLAIVDYLAERTERRLYWPEEPAARGHARAIAAEMHAGFATLRREHPTNYRRAWPAGAVSETVTAELARIAALWSEARGRWGEGGPFLYGGWGAADMMYAPVVARILTYALPVPQAALDYCAAVRAHPDVARWYDEAAAEPWVIAAYERDDAGA